MLTEGLCCTAGQSIIITGGVIFLIIGSVLFYCSWKNNRDLRGGHRNRQEFEYSAI